MVKCYGLYWRPELVNWGRQAYGGRGELIGVFTKDRRRFRRDFWEEIGVYVLYDNYRIVYIGRTTKERLGSRLRSHWNKRGERWDSFSWYGLRAPSLTKDRLLSVGKRKFSGDDTIRALEAILIEVCDPLLNRRHERIKDAIRARQAPPEGLPKDEAEMLREIYERIVSDKSQEAV